MKGARPRSAAPLRRRVARGITTARVGSYYVLLAGRPRVVIIVGCPRRQGGSCGAGWCLGGEVVSPSAWIL